MTKKTVVPVDALAKPRGVWSTAIVSEPRQLAFICGLIARNKDGQLVGKGDMGAQTRQVCENLKAAVEATGGTLADLVRVDVYTTDVDEFDTIHAVRREYFPDEPPVSTMVEISRLVDKDALIEINAIAVLR